MEAVEEVVEVAGMVDVPVTVTPCRIEDIIPDEAVVSRRRRRIINKLATGKRRVYYV